MSDRLEQLKQRWEADPASRHFLQYAEELRRLGRSDEAEPVLEAGLSHHPNWIAAQVSLARCRLEAQRYEGAAAGLEAVVRKDPTQMVAYRLLIDAYIGLGDCAAAAERLELYRELNPQDPQCEVLEARMKALDEASHQAGDATAPAADAPLATVVIPSHPQSPAPPSPVVAPIQPAPGESASPPTIPGPASPEATPPPPTPSSATPPPAALTPPSPVAPAIPPPPAADFDSSPSSPSPPPAAAPEPSVGNADVFAEPPVPEDTPEPESPAEVENVAENVATPESLGFAKMATEPNIQIGEAPDQPLVDLPTMQPRPSETVEESQPIDEPVLDTAPSAFDHGALELPLQDMPSSSLTDFPQSIELPDASNEHTDSALAALGLEGTDPSPEAATSSEPSSPMEVLMSEERPTSGAGAYAVQAMINLPEGRENVEQVTPGASSPVDSLLSQAESSDQEPGEESSHELPAAQSVFPELADEPVVEDEPSPLATMRLENIPASLFEREVGSSDQVSAVESEAESPVDEPVELEAPAVLSSETPIGEEPPAEVDPPRSVEDEVESPTAEAFESSALFPQIASQGPVVDLDLKSILSAPPRRALARGGRLAATSEGEASPATVTLGGLYLDQGHSREAKQIFEKVLDEDPSNPTARDGLSKANAMPAKVSAEELLSGYTEADGGGLSEKKAYVLESYMQRIKQGQNDDVS